MRRTHAVAVLVLLLTLLPVACEPAGPHYRTFCSESHTEMRLVPLPHAGVSVGPGLSLMPMSECDAWDSVWVAK